MLFRFFKNLFDKGDAAIAVYYFLHSCSCL